MAYLFLKRKKRLLKKLPKVSIAPVIINLDDTFNRIRLDGIAKVLEKVNNDLQ